MTLERAGVRDPTGHVVGLVEVVHRELVGEETVGQGPWVAFQWSTALVQTLGSVVTLKQEGRVTG